MAYSEELADRIRSIIGDRDDLVEKKMFGGLAFMLHGNMSVGITGDDLMLRVGADSHDDVMAREHARPWTSPAAR